MEGSSGRERTSLLHMICSESIVRVDLCFRLEGRCLHCGSDAASHLTMSVSLHGCGLLDVQLWVSSTSMCVCVVFLEGFAGRCNSPTALLGVLFVCMYV